MIFGDSETDNRSGGKDAAIICKDVDIEATAAKVTTQLSSNAML